MLIRQIVAYLLIALLPLQAATAGRMALCAEMQKPVHGAMAMTDCGHMADMPRPSLNDSTASHLHHADSCWIGSICLAGIAAFPIPMQQLSAPVERSTPRFSAAPVLYLSVVLDHPQRPPAML